MRIVQHDAYLHRSMNRLHETRKGIRVNQVVDLSLCLVKDASGISEGLVLRILLGHTMNVQKYTMSNPSFTVTARRGVNGNLLLRVKRNPTPLVDIKLTFGHTIRNWGTFRVACFLPLHIRPSGILPYLFHWFLQAYQMVLVACSCTMFNCNYLGVCFVVTCALCLVRNATSFGRFVSHLTMVLVAHAVSCECNTSFEHLDVVIIGENCIATCSHRVRPRKLQYNMQP